MFLDQEILNQYAHSSMEAIFNCYHHGFSSGSFSQFSFQLFLTWNMGLVYVLDLSKLSCLPISLWPKPSPLLAFCLKQHSYINQGMLQQHISSCWPLSGVKHSCTSWKKQISTEPWTCLFFNILFTQIVPREVSDWWWETPYWWSRIPLYRSIA